MLSAVIQTALVNPWDVIEGALARRKPARDQAWLAHEAGVTVQAVTNWKKRGVPSGQFAALADILGLSMEQVAGRESPPWELAESAWPFPDIERGRFDRLSERQKGEIQSEVRRLIDVFEAQRSGKFTPSPSPVSHRRKAA